MKPIDPTKLKNVEKAARYLLGCQIVRTLDNGEILSGMVVETEGYHQTDPASHTFRGQTLRNAAMFGPPAHAYIYFTYGMHWCFNVTAGVEGEGSGVLIRAIEPLSGIDVMTQNRHLKPQSSHRGQISGTKSAGSVPGSARWQVSKLRNLTNGPGKLTQALAIDKSFYGHDLSKPPLQVFEYKSISDSEVVESTRIGIKKAADRLWRFYIAGNHHVSKY